jgi:hypothetical protein
MAILPESGSMATAFALGNVYKKNFEAKPMFAPQSTISARFPFLPMDS